MTDEEKRELEELRAYKASIEAKKAEPVLQPIEKRVMDDYNQGKPPVDIARRHNIPVEQVLTITGNQDMLHVAVIGDQVDPETIGNQGTYNAGQVYRVPYSTN